MLDVITPSPSDQILDPCWSINRIFPNERGEEEDRDRFHETGGLLPTRCRLSIQILAKGDISESAMSAAREIKSIRAACFLSSRIEEMMAPSREEWRWISQRNEDTVERFFDRGISLLCGKGELPIYSMNLDPNK